MIMHHNSDEMGNSINLPTVLHSDSVPFYIISPCSIKKNMKLWRTSLESTSYRKNFGLSRSTRMNVLHYFVDAKKKYHFNS